MILRPPSVPFVHRPRPTLRVGVTGPTKVHEVALASIVRKVLDAVAFEGARIVMVSCLAEGVDQVCAQVASERRDEVWAVIPARMKTYAGRIKDETARARFDLLTSAKKEVPSAGVPRPATVVLELDMPFPLGDDESSGNVRQSAYLEANIVMLEHTDLLLSVIPTAGDGARIGGATSTLRVALNKLIPAVVIRPRSIPEFIVLGQDSIRPRERVSPAIERLFRNANAAQADEDALRSLARTLLGTEAGNGVSAHVS